MNIRTAGNQYTLALLLICAMMASCVSTPVAKSVNVTLDETFGNYEQKLEPDLVLITMTPQQHASLTSYRLPNHNSTPELPPLYADYLSNIENQYGLVRVADWPLPAIDIFCIVFENQSDQSRDDIIAQLVNEPGIESAQLVQSFEVQQQPYNDPFLSLQHGFRSLRAESSHQWARGRGVSVAVIDTGLDVNHPDLENRTATTKNFVDTDRRQFAADVHGTAVAGVIAAAADNGTGMVGVAPEATLLALKACWQQATEREDRAVCNSLTLAKALNYAILEQADIINLSLAGPPDPLLERLVKKALAENLIVVGALPQENVDSFPTSIEGTIAVAMPGVRSSAVVAPGQQVLSTYPGDEYEFYTGSSFSTAHIAGLAALLRELSPRLSAADVLALLNRTAEPTTGAADACLAIAELIKPELIAC
ncbi:MAG: S8 family serine peptidase [Granulosicoccus sp.]|nr:S8 family serine peptidase [Granulosicoccus sp.]